MAARVVELLTIAEAADRTGLSYSSVWRFASEGKFPVYKGGRAKTWHVSSIELSNFMENYKPSPNDHTSDSSPEDKSVHPGESSSN